MARVKIVQADGDKAYGDQNTDGSNSIRGIYEDMRRVGATARVMLVAAAAKRWNVRAEDCVARDHAVTHLPTGRALGFGELALEAGKQKVPAAKDVALRPVSELTHLGKPLPLLDGPAYVTGQAIYRRRRQAPGDAHRRHRAASGRRRQGRAFRRDASAGGPGRAQSDRDPAAEAAVRVPAVGRRRRDCRPHVGGDAWTRRARRDVGATVRTAVTTRPSTGTSLPRRSRCPGTVARKVGDPEAALKSAARVVEAEYHVPHLPHVPMEPPVAVAHVSGNRCEVWAPTQNPQAAQTEVARVLGMPPDNVRVHVTFLGGGFGRKSKADFCSEAALLSSGSARRCACS